MPGASAERPDQIGKSRYERAWAARCARGAPATVAGASEHAEEADAAGRARASVAALDGRVGHR